MVVCGKGWYAVLDGGWVLSVCDALVVCLSHAVCLLLPHLGPAACSDSSSVQTPAQSLGGGDAVDRKVGPGARGPCPLDSCLEQNVLVCVLAATDV